MTARRLPRPAAAALLAFGGALALALVTGPRADAQAAPAAAQGALPARVDEISYPPLPAFALPAPRREVLPNGLVVLLSVDRELPLVAATALLPAGSRLDPADRAGLARLGAAVLRTGGAGARDGDALDDFLEGKAAVIETAAGSAQVQASMSCLAADLPAVLAAFADVLRRPAFTQDKLTVAKNQRFAGIARQNDDPQRILFREFSERVWGEDSPYARPETYASVGGVTRDDLVAWHGRHFRPDGMVLGLVGDFDPERALAWVREAFGDWPAAGGPKPEPPPHGDGPRPGLYFVEKNDVNQVAVAMGHLGVREDDPRIYAVELANGVLGGSFSSRLVAEIRTARGLAYAVNGAVGADWDVPGVTTLWMTTKTESATDGVKALLDEARDLSRRPPTTEEVARARDALLNSFIFNVDSPEKILRQQTVYTFYGYPLDRMERYRRGLEEATVDQVRAAAAELVHPDRFAILVVGPAPVREQLKTLGLGEVTEIDVTIPEPPG